MSATLALRLLAGAVAVACAAGVCAQSGAGKSTSDYPTRSVRLLVGFPPGGGADLLARVVGEKMTEDLRQQIVVDNRGGGGGTIATNMVAKAAPDGYNLLLMSIGIAFAPALYRNLPYDLQKELAPVALLVTQPCVLAIHPGVPAKTVKEFVALAKSRPREFLYSSSGSGSAAHLAAELFRAKANIDLGHVPYKGGPQIITSLLAGEVHMVIAGIATVQPHVRAGRLRGLATTGIARAKAAPELPTIAEAGVPGAEFDIWYGMLAPAATPAAIVKTINQSFNRVIAAPDVQERIAGAGFEPLGGTPEKFAAYLKAEIRKWSDVVRSAGIQGE